MKQIPAIIFKQLLKGDFHDHPDYAGLFFNGDPKRLVFQNCVFQEDITFKEDLICEFEIEFRSCKFIKHLRIENGTFLDISFFGTEFSQSTNFTIIDGSFKNISFDNSCKFLGHFNIHSGRFEKVRISNSEFSNSVSFVNGNFHNIEVSGNTKIANLFFRRGNYRLIRINGGEMNELHFSGGNFNNIMLYGLVVVQTIYISKGVISHLLLAAVNVAQLIAKDFEKSGSLSIAKLIVNQMGKLDALFLGFKISEIHFSDAFLHKDSILRFQNVEVETLNFVDFICFGQLGFSNLSIQKQMNITNSDLGKASFISSSIENIILNLENSRITDVFFSNTAFPSRVSDDDFQQRLTYAQIKKINEAKGDYLESNRFYALEMEAFYKTITWKENFWEKLNLWMNKVSNFHGQSWMVGLRFLVGCVCFFYVSYIFALGFRIGSLGSRNDWGVFFKVLSFIFEFTNPVHKSEEIAKGLGASPTVVARVLEGFSRIAIGYGIYQMVQAFRKHGKK